MQHDFRYGFNKSLSAIKFKGLALLEVVLGVVVVTIAIGILVNFQSGSSHENAAKSSARDLSVLVNKSLKRAFEAFESGQGGYHVGDQETCTVNFDSYEMHCTGTEGSESAPLVISQDYLKQLKKKGVTSYDVTMSVVSG